MFKLNKFIYIILVLVFTSVQSVFATDNFTAVRVGISDTAFRTYIFDNVEFLNANNLKVMDASTGYTVPVNDMSSCVKVTSENNLYKIYLDGELVARNVDGPILVSSLDRSPVKIKDLKRKGKQAAYRGYIELARSSKDISKFSIVNVLSLKNYLRGVVPNEMPVRFGLEALKAQTVAARNYAVTPRVKSYNEFDLCDSVACQVYFGANTEEFLSDRAIEETNGIIALDKENKPILALYSSTAGGYTESYEYAFSDPQTRQFPSKDIHYLTAVPDRAEFGVLDTEEAAENFYMTKPEAFDDQSPYYRWEKQWTASELSSVLAKTLPAQAKTGFIYPNVSSSDEVGNIISVNVLMRGKSGKIIRLQINTDKNTFIVNKELVIRRCFQKNGISLPSANFVVTKSGEGNPIFIFTGGGFGHGVGLSQWGAGKMGTLGYTFDKILQHYYKGIKLATIPAEINSTIKPAERFFYTENKEGKVYIINPSNVQRVRVSVNQNSFELKLKGYQTVEDISRYLEKGVNRISFLILDDNAGFSKKITAFAEV